MKIKQDIVKQAVGQRRNHKGRQEIPRDESDENTVQCSRGSAQRDVYTADL